MLHMACVSSATKLIGDRKTESTFVPMARDGEKLMLKWRQENHDKVRETKWRHTGIDCTYAQYKELEAAQSGCCALCGNPDKGRHLAVDHHHNTGRIRGLLCRPCNQAIGVLEKRGVNSIVLAKYLASET